MNLVRFFALAFAAMWALFFTVAFAVPASKPLGYAMLLLGAYAPGIVAVWLTARAEGKAGVAALLGRILKWNVPVRYYLFASGYMIAIKLTAAVVHRVAAGAWPAFGTEPLYLIPFAVMISTPFQAGEEVGWRGYALPRLAARFGLARASLLLGVVWGVWHLPQFFIQQADTYSQSFFVFVLEATALSVAMAWLYARTNGSLFLVMLLHSAVNNTKDIVPSPVPGGTAMFGFTSSMVAWTTVTLMWICAAYSLVTMPEWEPLSAGSTSLRRPAGAP